MAIFQLMRKKIRAKNSQKLRGNDETENRIC